MMGKMISKGWESGGLYILDASSSIPASLACSSVLSPIQIHYQLGHSSLQSLKTLVPCLSSLSNLECESCQFGKHHRVSYSPRVNKRSVHPFHVVHSDIWGPSLVLSN
ncbi:gag_pre-integrs domain-containing protein [Cephalotus follicularis]|uniref:Gag_pre-integrs domain-containing protein n=1 Tax=Cephalotus follicularis TaxID=3775 RepID=A0A1Q3CLH2_CEPFO|nr:gag_pre-integrs domain-containing protein [Cephalotus follicularis]